MCIIQSLLDMFIVFFFNDTATTEIYTLSLHDALPIWLPRAAYSVSPHYLERCWPDRAARSEEHTSELQSRGHLVCRLLLEKKKTNTTPHTTCPIKISHPFLPTSPSAIPMSACSTPPTP